jgi:hypothetical protein
MFMFPRYFTSTKQTILIHIIDIGLSGVIPSLYQINKSACEPELNLPLSAYNVGYAESIEVRKCKHFVGGGAEL